jgi:hypothetical protein
MLVKLGRQTTRAVSSCTRARQTRADDTASRPDSGGQNTQAL